MNRNKFSVIKINGFKGLALVVFLIGCFAAGFVIFPAWLCQNIWNFVASYFSVVPEMQLLHGVLLWAIIALSFYALNKDTFTISVGTSVPRAVSEDRIKEILKQMSEKNDLSLHHKENNDIIENNQDDEKVEQ